MPGPTAGAAVGVVAAVASGGAVVVVAAMAVGVGGAAALAAAAASAAGGAGGEAAEAARGGVPAGEGRMVTLLSATKSLYQQGGALGVASGGRLGSRTWSQEVDSSTWSLVQAPDASSLDTSSTSSAPAPAPAGNNQIDREWEARQSRNENRL